jgi:hypothetical protein
MVCNTNTDDQSRQRVGESNMIETTLRFPAATVIGQEGSEMREVGRAFSASHCCDVN